MFWFKCAMESNSLQLAVDEIGKAGAFEVIQAVSTAMSLSMIPSELNEKNVSRMAGVKIDRARRLLPYVIDFLTETKSIPNHSEKSKKSTGNHIEISEETGRKVQEISEKSTGNLPDSDGSNPDGSTRVKSIVDNSKVDSIREDNIPPTPQGDEPDIFAIRLETATRQRIAAQGPSLCAPMAARSL